MARFVFFALIGLVLWAWWSRRSAVKGPSDSPPPSPKTGADVIVPCAHCGMHFPQSDGVAFTSGTTTVWYCSTAHRDQGPHQAP